MDSVRGDDGCSTPAQLAISGDTTLPSIESLVIAHVQQRLRATQQQQLLFHKDALAPPPYAARTARPGTPMVQQTGAAHPVYPADIITRSGQVRSSDASHLAHIYSRLNASYSPPAMLAFEPSPPDGFHRDLLRPPDATDAEVERNLRSSEEAHARLMALRRCQSLSPPGIVQSAFETRCHSLTNMSTFSDSQIDNLAHPAPLAPLSHSADVTQSGDADAGVDPLTHASGKLMVTDLDQEASEALVSRVSRRESPVPVLIDGTR